MEEGGLTAGEEGCKGMGFGVGVVIDGFVLVVVGMGRGRAVGGIIW